MKKRVISTLMVGVMTVAALVGGSGKAVFAKGSDDEKVTLRWLQNQVEYTDQVKNMAKAYEKEHPNVSIEVEVIDDDYYDILKTKASSGDMPDVFMTGPEISITREKDSGYGAREKRCISRQMQKKF